MSGSGVYAILLEVAGDKGMAKEGAFFLMG